MFRSIFRIPPLWSLLAALTVTVGGRILKERMDDTQLTKHFDQLYKYLDERFDLVDQRIDDFEKRVDKRFDAVGDRFDVVEERLDGIETTVNAIYQRLGNVEAEHAAMNQQLDRHERWHHQTADKLGLQLDH